MALVALPHRPGSQETRSIADILADLDAITAQTDGNLDEANMAPTFAKAKVEPAFSGWKPIWISTVSLIWGGGGGGTYMFFWVGGSSGDAFVMDQYNVLPLNPAWFTADTRTTKYSLRARWRTNGTSPGQGITLGMYPLNLSAQANNSNQYTRGTVVSGSQFTIANPGASAFTAEQSSEFTAPASGLYGIGYTRGADFTTNHFSELHVALMMRQV